MQFQPAGVPPLPPEAPWEMSFFGGLVGIAVLALAAPVVSEFALRFQPRDYMFLAILGILLVGSLSSGSLVKGIFAGAFGIAVGAVGMDPLTFTERFTFDVPVLKSGCGRLLNGFMIWRVLCRHFTLKKAKPDSRLLKF